MVDKLTEEQIKEFWEWCGFICKEDKEAVLGRKWVSPDGYTCFANIRGAYTCPPDIDLNNLFKYAVPIAVEEVMLELGRDYDDALHSLIHNWMVLMRGKKDPALALFWALWQVKGKSNE